MSQYLSPGFSREQLSALRLDRHSIVSAAAGSGKTSVLVERYIHILLSGIHPRNIVAITFTRKAAAEMVGRITQRIDQLLSGTVISAADRARLREIQPALSSARVSTIHAFCASILREFPVEAGVSPDFVDCGSGELHRIQTAAIQHVLEDWMKSEERRDAARELIFRCGQRSVEEFLKELSSDQYHILQTKQFYDQNSDAQILRERDVRVRAELDSLLPQFRTLTSSLLEVLNAASLTAVQRTIADEAITSWNSLENGVFVYGENNELSTVARNLQRIEAAVKPLRTKAGAFLAWVKKKSTSEAIVDRLQDILPTLSVLSENLTHGAIDGEMLRCARTLQAMSEDVLAEMDNEKHEMSALDFDDLQLIMLRLLQSDEVCRRIRRSIPYLMIDEFQDTNDLQYGITRRLVRALQGMESRESTEADPNLFIVGDAKQSIYGFRKADVRVFESARHDIIRANEWSSGEPREQSPGDVHLSASYRMAPRLVAFVNLLCGNIMPAQTEGYEVAYESMICGRKKSTDVDSHIELLIGSKPSKSTSGRTSQNEEEINGEGDSDDAQTFQREGGLLAARIQKILSDDSDWLIWDEKDNRFRRPIPQDIAILSRKASVLDVLSFELHTQGIPAVRAGGKGYYTRQEVIDLNAVLHFLQNETDDVALAASLRSPLFGFSDALLYTLRANAGKKTLWQCLQQHARVQTSTPHNASSKKDQERAEVDLITDVERLDRARTLLERMKDQIRYSSIAQSLRFILRETAFYGTVHHDERADQIKANVEKFMDIVRDIESRGFRQLYDVVVELDRLRDIDDAQAEAPVFFDENAVRLLTIHAAKGLEFPIVVVADAGFSVNTGRQFYTSETLGHCFKIRDANGQPMSGLLYEHLKEIAKQRDIAEDKRLFYVALTRARDHLLISCEQKVSAESQELAGSGFLPFVRATYSQPFGQESGVVLERECRVARLLDGERVEETVTVPLRVVRNEQSVVLPLNTSANAASYVRPMLRASLDIRVRGESFSATQLMTFKRDPAEYYRVYYMGLPPSDDNGFPARSVTTESEPDIVTGTLAGELIHETLSRFREWWNEQGQVEKEKLESVITDVIANQEIAGHDELRERVRADVTRTMLSPWLQSQRSAMINARSEYTLTMPMNADFLTGTMDVIVPCNDGTIEIWDWKTNRLDQRSSREWLEYYELQLQVYCCLLAECYPEQQEFRARLIFTRDASQEHMVLSRQQIIEVRANIQQLITAINDMNFGTVAKRREDVV